MEDICALPLRERDPYTWTALDMMEHLAMARATGDMRLAEDCRLGLKSLHTSSETGRFTIAVGFDGVLCVDAWPRIGDAKRDIISYLKTLRESYGVRLILFTPRTGELYMEAREWCHSQGLRFDAYNENLPAFFERYGDGSRRIYADEQWDNHAVRI